MRILFIIYEPWPTHRADIAALFGKYLRRRGVVTDLVAEAADCGKPSAFNWDGGRVIGSTRPSGRAAQHLAKLWLNVKSAFTADKAHYDCIQVRDMSLSALAGLLAARINGIHFVYWLSYLQSEGHIMRARARGPRAGVKYWYPLIEGLIGHFIVYKIVLPRADHVFVQSDAMKERLVQLGLSSARMTSVPMGVDLEDISALPALPSIDPELRGRRPLVYLGIQDPERHVEILLAMLARVKASVPNVVLVMAGDTHDQTYRESLRDEAARLGVADDVIWTGWISRTEAWNHVRAAEIGLSPFPRGEVLDTCSPTKAVEYMALGVPVIGNDNPDQKRVIEASGGGLCTSLDAEAFANAVILLMQDDAVREKMAVNGQDYVRKARSYARLAAEVAVVYENVCGATLIGDKKSTNTVSKAPPY